MLLDILEKIAFVDCEFQIFYSSQKIDRTSQYLRQTRLIPRLLSGKKILHCAVDLPLAIKLFHMNRPSYLESANLLANVRHLNELLYILSC